MALCLGVVSTPGVAQMVGRTAAGSTAVGPVVEIPLRVAGGWLVVAGVTASGDTIDLILDTGAAQSGVTRGLASRLALETVDNVAAYGASGAVKVEVVDLPPIYVGGIDAGSRRAVVVLDSVLTTHAGEPLSGFLGAPFLRLFDVLIDAPGEVVRLYERGTAPQKLEAVLDADDGVPFRISRSGLISLEANLNGQTARGLFDTGARHLILNWMAAERAGIPTSENPVSERTRGVGSEIVRAHSGRIDELELGATKWSSVEAEVADLPIFHILGLREPTLLVGAPVVRGCPVLISYVVKTLRFCRQPA